MSLVELATPGDVTSPVRSAVRRVKYRRDMAEDNRSLLPGIPDHVAQLCLSLVPSSTLHSVCRSWRRLIYSPSFPPFLSIYALLAPIGSRPNDVVFSSFDPIAGIWRDLPPPPRDLPLILLWRHPSFISRKLPIQSVTAYGKLVLLAATNDRFLPALSRPLVFDTRSGEWSHGPPLSTPRRWCAAGSSEAAGAVYVASGFGTQYNTDVARSVEKWDLRCGDAAGTGWARMRGLKNGKFSRDAIDGVGWRGKLCMVNVKGDAAKEGIVYDVVADAWGPMPEGMLAGWRGPAAAMEEETIYVVDESKGALRRYNHATDAWEEIAEIAMLRGAQQVAAARGKVCVLCADGTSIAVVDVAGTPPERVWVVSAPPGFQILAIHILPRLSQ